MMRNNRKNLLERLYDGEFYPLERMTPGDPDYAVLSHKECEEIEYMTSRLDGEDAARFEALIDLSSDLSDMNGYANFTYGLQTGILLMFELFFNEDDPPFRERR